MNIREATQAMLRGIVGFTEEHGFAPSVRELAAEVGYRSADTVHRHLNRLRNEGMVAWVDRTPRTLVVTPKGMEAIGRNGGSVTGEVESAARAVVADARYVARNQMGQTVLRVSAEHWNRLIEAVKA